jgi:probable F420-dependent oxidoreductase
VKYSIADTVRSGQRRKLSRSTFWPTAQNLEVNARLEASVWSTDHLRLLRDAREKSDVGTGKLGITVPLSPLLADQADGLRRLAQAGYTEMWTSETSRGDAFTPLAHVAGILPDVVLGTAIASVFVRGPAELAMSAASVAECAPGRFMLGIGASSPALVTGFNGIPYERPVQRVRDTARFLRRALAGERIDEEYASFTIRGFRLERPPDPPPLLLIGALRPTMLHVALDEADGVVLNWLGADDVPTMLAEMAAGSCAPEVVARIFVCASSDRPAVRAAARRFIASYLTVPAYAAFHDWLGHGDLLAETLQRWQRGDRRGAADAVPDELVDALIVHGTAEECAAGINEYVKNGVTRPVLKMLPFGAEGDLVTEAETIARILTQQIGFK